MRVFAIFGALIGCVCVTAAQDPYGTKSETYLNTTVTASLGISRITEDGLKISGSNVYISTQATAKHRIVDPAPSNPVTNVRMYKVTLTAGGGQIFQDVDNNIDWNDPSEELFAQHGPSATPDPASFPLVREPRDAYFASTHFAHGTELVITLSVEFKFKLQDGTIAPTTTTATATIKPTVYNYAVIWRTNVGSTGSGFVDLIQPILGWVEDDYAKLKEKFEDANYEVGGNETDTRTAITNNFGLATAIAAETHGGTLGVAESYGIGSSYTIVWEHATNPDFYNKLIANGDRYGATLSQSMMPPVSLVAFYACTTYPYALPSYLWLWRDPLNSTSPVLNGATIGFGQDLAWADNCDDHIATLFSELAAGRCLADAVQKADLDYPQKLKNSKVTVVVPMSINGDPNATLSKVYLPASLRAATRTFNDWKRIVPATW